MEREKQTARRRDTERGQSHTHTHTQDEDLELIFSRFGKILRFVCVVEDVCCVLSVGVCCRGCVLSRLCVCCGCCVHTRAERDGWGEERTVRQRQSRKGKVRRERRDHNRVWLRRMGIASLTVQ